MSVRAESVIIPGVRDRTAVASPGNGAASTVAERAGGIELLGKFARSGHRRPPALVRRADGQIIQLTPLLYELLQQIDGRKDYGEIAELVGARIGKIVTADDVRVLTESKLRPLGVLRTPDGSEPVTKKANPLLALRLRMVVTNERITNGIAALFAWLFWPPIVTVFSVAFLTTITWLLFDRGLGAATRQALYEPGLLLFVFALTTLSAGFHELGHAAACRYSGGRPGAMGIGLYLVWPAFYTDVSDSYRLSRRGRLRVDVGGIYFNAIFAVGALAAWMATRWEALLIVIALQGLQMLRQLIPLVRLDGYHILADLTGVPDLFAHVGPILRSLIPTRARRAEVKELKPWVRFVVTAWVLLVVPVLAAILVLLVLTLPRVIATAWDSLGLRWGALQEEFASNHFATAGTEILAILGLAIPVLSVAYMLSRVVHRTARRVWKKTADRPGRRAVAVLVAAGLIASIAMAWWPHGQYRPIEETETGTLFALPEGPWLIDNMARQIDPEWALTAFAVREPMSLAVPAPGVDADDSRAPVVAAADAVESHTAVANNGTFPFPLPAPPGEGDNQALAVNLTDGATLIDMALSLIFTAEEIVDNSNEAYALASCVRCVTVAIAFQVILIQGEALTSVVPENTAAAINAECAACLSYAVASQIVVHLYEPLSDQQLAELRTIWAKLQQLEANAGELSVATVTARFENLREQIATLLGVDEAATDEQVDDSAPGDDGDGALAATPSPSPSATLTPSAVTPSATPTSSPDPEPTSSPDPEPTSSPSPEPSSSP